jgi:hypothetical protein
LILVAGGQLDPNIGRFLKRLIELDVPFKELIVGPDCNPSIAFELGDTALNIDGERVHPTSAFIRHDVFWSQQCRDKGYLPSVALNWYYAIRGWMLSNEKIRCFNRFSSSSENNKIFNLCHARKCGLQIGETLVATLSSSDIDRYLEIEAIVKPVAGGSLTTELRSSLSLSKPQTGHAPSVDYPRFVQKKLDRPEVRVFGVGDQVFAFSITSVDLDYRERHQAKIEMIVPPEEVVPGLKKLAGILDLTFYAADFMRDDAKNLVFLEINTQPMFVAFDNISGGRIADAAISFLEPSIERGGNKCLIT